MNITQLNVGRLAPNEQSALQEVLDKSSEATIFHTIEWNQILVETFGINNVTFIAKNGNSPVGMLVLNQYFDEGPRTIYYSPDKSLETVYGGPLVIADITNKDVVKMELMKQLDLISKASIVQMWLQPYASPEFLNKLHYSCRPFYTSIVNLEKSEADLWRNLHNRARNRVRKAQKSGIKIVTNGTSYFSEYYELVKASLGSRGISFLPREFYRKVLSTLEPKNMAKLFIAIYNDAPIAGNIFLFYKDTIYNWHTGGLKEYLSLAPNDLLQWESIKYAQRNGYKKYDLVSIEPHKLPGIAKYKMKFGGETIIYYRGFWKTPFYRPAVMVHCFKRPSYVYKTVKKKLTTLRSLG